MAVATRSQHLAALEVANRVRLRRAEIKRALGKVPTTEGAGILALQVEDPERACLTWRTTDAMACLHRVGRSRTLRLLRHVGIPERKPLGDLTDRQRDALLEELGKL